MGLKVKYNRVSTLQQSGDRFTLDDNQYDLTLFDKISGSISFNDRPEASKLVRLVNDGLVSEVYLEDLSRIGRSITDTINTLNWLSQMGVNIIIQNLGIQSIPNGKKNPIWPMITAILSSMNQMELENIRERTTVGRQVYVQRGGKLGRPGGSFENHIEFLKKEKNQEIVKLIKKKRTYTEIAKILNVSPKTISKVRRVAEKEGLLL